MKTRFTSYSEASKALKKAGWHLKRCKGGHNHFCHEEANRTLTLPATGKFKRNLEQQVLIALGLKKGTSATSFH